MTSPILENPYAAPEVSGPDGHDKLIKPDHFKNLWKIVYFYPKDSTPGCITEAVDFQRLSEDFTDMNGVIIGISKDSCESHRKFMDKQGLRFTLISDGDGNLCQRFGVWKEKINYGKRYMGIERSTFIINPENQIVAEWRKVKVTGHAQEVLDTLKICRKNRIKPKYQL